MSDRKSYPARVFLTVATDDGLELWSTTRRNPNSIEYRHVNQVNKLTNEKGRTTMSFIKRELDRVTTAMQGADTNDQYVQLYAAQQALSWALDPEAAAAPLEVILSGRAERVTSSSAKRSLDNMKKDSLRAERWKSLSAEITRSTNKAIAWTWSEACRQYDAGLDPRQYDSANLISRAKTELTCGITVDQPLLDRDS